MAIINDTFLSKMKKIVINFYLKVNMLAEKMFDKKVICRQKCLA